MPAERAPRRTRDPGRDARRGRAGAARGDAPARDDGDPTAEPGRATGAGWRRENVRRGCRAEWVRRASAVVRVARAEAAAKIDTLLYTVRYTLMATCGVH